MYNIFLYLCLEKTKIQQLITYIILTYSGITKHALAALSLILTISGCEHRSHISAQNDSSAVEDSFQVIPTTDTLTSEMSAEVQEGIILERVKDIYYMIRSDYMSHGGSFDNELYDQAFCSQSWNRLMMRVHRKEYETGTLFFEINHWAMAQYTSIPFYDEFRISYLNLHSRVKRAVVSFMVYEDYSYTPARIELVYEDNQWKIDNFYNMKYKLNVRTAMWNYIHRPYLI